MLKTVCKEFHLVNPICQTIRLCSQTSDYSRPLERNEVQISGTIEHKVRKMRHDVLSFYLKTRDLDHGFCIHKISIPNENLRLKLKNVLRINQGVYIGGRLKTEGIQLGRNEWIHNSEILATELYFLDENLKPSESVLPAMFEKNTVKLFGFITSQIHRRMDYTTFCVGTHYKTKKVDGGEVLESHCVRISRSSPLHAIIKNLRKGDRVFIQGPLDYKTVVSPDGKDVPTAFISAKFFIQLKRLQNKNFSSVEIDEIVDVDQR